MISKLLKILAITLLLSVPALAHEGNGFWHLNGSTGPCVGIKNMGLGMQAWYIDNGGPYYHDRSKNGGRPYDEVRIFIYNHGKMHYYQPELLYNREGR